MARIVLIGTLTRGADRAPADPSHVLRTPPLMPSVVANSSTIASLQHKDDGTPRFLLVPPASPSDNHVDWEAAAHAEATSGVEPSIRLFLDAQLEPGDLVVDLSPGAGFVALAAATSPAQPHVIALGQSAQACEELAANAEANDLFLEVVDATALSAEEFTGLVQDRLLPDQRLFVHASHAHTERWLASFAVLADAGVLVAWCAGGDATESELLLSNRLLSAHGFVVHELAELEGEAQLFSATAPAPESIALHQTVLGERAPDGDPSQGTATPGYAVREGVAHGRGLNFIAPYCRTGYGIVGAHLLRGVMLRGVPTTFFPLGAVDSSVLPMTGLRAAMARQESFDSNAPSVRLSQQFDLALHVGRGEHVGFPIFELTRFTAHEKHHLSAQDRLLVCSEWARGVLLENGIWKAPVHVVPLGVDRDVFHERHRASRTAGRTVFVQVGKLEPRKGQLELLRAFEDAFSSADQVELVLACFNPFLDADAFKHALLPFRQSRLAKQIRLVTKPLSSQLEVAKLLASADCGVFVSRAEGWNLEALEMLSVGGQVIATNYGGHTEFLTEQNARLIDVNGTEHVPSSYPGASDGAAWGSWSAQEHEQLVTALRSVHTARQEDALPVNLAGIATAEQFSWDNSAATMLGALGQY